MLVPLFEMLGRDRTGGISYFELREAWRQLCGRDRGRGVVLHFKLTVQIISFQQNQCGWKVWHQKTANEEDGRERMRLISIGWSPWHIRNGSLLPHVLSCSRQRVISVRRFFFWSPVAASQRRGRYVHQSKGAKLSGGEGREGAQGEGAPNRCREQTGSLQLDMDEVAHKMLFNN